MTRLIIYFLILFISLNKSVAQPLRNANSLQTKIIIIGDAGGVINGKQPVVDAVRNNFVLDEKTLIVYLGDNLYHNGLPDEASPYYDSLRAVLDSQIVIANCSVVLERSNFYNANFATLILFSLSSLHAKIFSSNITISTHNLLQRAG